MCLDCDNKLNFSVSTIAGTNGINGINGTNGQRIDHTSFTSTTAISGLAGESGETDTYTVWAEHAEHTALGTYTVLQGQSVDHSSFTSTDNVSGLPNEFGAIDTYTLWGDVAETLALGTFTIQNGKEGSIIVHTNFTPINATSATAWETLNTYALPANAITDAGEYLDIDINFQTAQNDVFADSYTASSFKLNVLGDDLIELPFDNAVVDYLKLFSVIHEIVGSNDFTYTYKMNIKLFHVVNTFNSIRPSVLFYTDVDNIEMNDLSNNNRSNINAADIVQDLSLGGDIKFDLKHPSLVINNISIKKIKV